jgi:hypothetical protein
VRQLLVDEGWRGSVERVDLLWRWEGPKIPKKQPERGRLWLNDGWCVRPGPERPDHVWSDDFVQDQTEDRHKLPMLTGVGEFAHRCLAVRVARRLRSTDIIDVLSDLAILRGVPGHIGPDNGPEFIAKAGARLDRRRRRPDRLDRAVHTVGKRRDRLLTAIAPTVDQSRLIIYRVVVPGAASTVGMGRAAHRTPVDALRRDRASAEASVSRPAKGECCRQRV